jgi:hypothetical protein
VIFVGKLDVLRVACPKCDREGRYALRRLIEQHERDGKIVDWLDALTADCPRRRAAGISDQCHARVPRSPEGGISARSARRRTCCTTPVQRYKYPA